jgi:zinc transporter ZupT
MKTWTFSGLLIGFAASACSSSYVPANSPRIATVWRGGYPSYYRDGNEYPSGMLLGGAETAVKGNPRAEKEARAAHQLMIGGLVCEVAGLGAVAPGVALTASNHSDTSTANEVGLGLIIGGIAASITAVVLFANAYPHAFDAVSIYNDGVDGAWRPPPVSTRSAAPSTAP